MLETRRIRAEFMGRNSTHLLAEEPRSLSLFPCLVFAMLCEISYIKKKN